MFSYSSASRIYADHMWLSVDRWQRKGVRLGRNIGAHANMSLATIAGPVRIETKLDPRVAHLKHGDQTSWLEH